MVWVTLLQTILQYLKTPFLMFVTLIKTPTLISYNSDKWDNVQQLQIVFLFLFLSLVCDHTPYGSCV
jgi:hypothetical protein